MIYTFYESDLISKPFCFYRQKENRSLYTPFVQFMGYRSIIDSLKNY